MLTLQLTAIDNVLGIYGTTKKEFPRRTSFLAPDAAISFVSLHRKFGGLKISDMFRSPESSLQAMGEKRGVQPPGYSAHNFGLAIDIDVDSMLMKLRINKTQLDTLMEQDGWFCHRTDHKREFEEWHYNFLGSNPSEFLDRNKSNTAHAIEARILKAYSSAFTPDNRELQRCLSVLKLYDGEIDGLVGPRTRESIKAFQRTWKLDDSGLVDPKTMRTLALVSATRITASTISVA